MRLFTGDECGLVKECIPELSRLESKEKDGPILPPRYNSTPIRREGVSRLDPNERQTRQRGVIDLSFLNDRDIHGGETASTEHSLAALRLDGSVEFWDGSAKSRKSFGSYGKLEPSIANVFDIDEGKVSNGNNSNPFIRPLGLGVFPQQKRLCAGDTCGNIVILSYPKDSSSCEKNDDSIVQRYNAYKSAKQCGSTISYTPGKYVNNHIATAMACDAVHGRVAVGGRERETTLVDMATGKVVFKAKNLPPDPQTLLQQPIWPSSLLFLGGSKKSNSVMAVGTAYKQVRLYDVRADGASQTRRPTAVTPETLLEHRVTALCEVDEYHLAVGDTAGYLFHLDTRMLGKKLRGKNVTVHSNMGRYVGPAGSVRQIKKHPTLPRLAAVGLDRMLRVFDTNTRKQLDCIYLKQRLNCVLFSPERACSTPNNGDFDDGDSSEDGYNGNEDEINWDLDQDDIVEDYIDSDEELGEGDQGAAENTDDASGDESDLESEDESLDDKDEIVSKEETDDDSSDDGTGDKNDSDDSDSRDRQPSRRKKQRRS